MNVGLRVVVVSSYLIVGFVSPTQAQFTYTTNADNNLTLVAYTPSPDSFNVLVPPTFNGLPVVSIGTNAFSAAKELSGVTILSTVTNIAADAFQGCPLWFVFFDGNPPAADPTSFVSSPGAMVYYAPWTTGWSSNFDGLTTVEAIFECTTNSDNTLTINYYTGGGGVIVPSSINGLTVTALGPGAFNGGPGLPGPIYTSVTIPDSVTNFGDGVFDGSDQLTNVTIPPGLTSIPPHSFYGAFSSGHLALPSTITNIGNNAFEYCGLDSISGPSTITNILPYTFAYSGNLTNVTLAGMSNIGDYAFYQDPLSSVYIGGGVVGNYAFWLSDTLTNVTFGDGLRSVGVAAFQEAPFGSLFIGDTVTNIGYAAFAQCGLTNLTFAPAVHATINGQAFLQNPLTSVYLPGGLTFTDDQVFGWCSNLTNVIFGAGVSNLSYGMFIGCNSLSNVFFMGNAPGLDGSYPSDGPPFDWDAGITVYYLPGTTGWGNSYQGVAAVMWNPVIQTGWPSFGVSNGQFGFNITSKANIPIVVAASTNLGSGPWVPLLSCTLTNIDDAPPLYFSDPFWSNYPSRFYRIAFPGQYPTITESPSVIITNAGFGIGNNQFGFTITGPANISVTVQATTNLPGGSWTNLQSFTLTNGSIYFTDPGWTNYPGRFYRMAYPSFP
jgi:hypothetical protein